jgi:fucose 4-O-acetylase-like acetyltransferase
MDLGQPSAEPLLLPKISSAADVIRGAHTNERIDLFDNAKAVLIVFVVLYHTTVVYTSADRPEAPIPLWSGLLAILKAVVMPCFCLISGHLSPAEIDQRRARSLCQLFITYLIFNGLYYLNLMLSFRLNGFEFKALPVQLFQPVGQTVTWFLLALLLWRITMPLLNRTRAPLAASVAVGLAGLFVDLGVNYQNIVSFWPYFVVGNRLPRALWRKHLASPPLRLAGAACLVLPAAAVLIFSVLGGDHFSEAFGRLALTYDCFNGAPPEAQGDACPTGRQLFSRLAFYASSAPLIIGFLSIVPSARGLWTSPGYMSMYVYLLHPLILFNPLVMHYAFEGLSVVYGREVNVWSPATDASVFGIVVPAALLACALLSSPTSRSLFRLLVEPPTDLFFKSLEESRPDAVPGAT